MHTLQWSHICDGIYYRVIEVSLCTIRQYKHRDCYNSNGRNTHNPNYSTISKLLFFWIIDAKDILVAILGTISIALDSGGRLSKFPLNPFEIHQKRTLNSSESINFCWSFWCLTRHNLSFLVSLSNQSIRPSIIRCRCSNDFSHFEKCSRLVYLHWKMMLFLLFAVCCSERDAHSHRRVWCRLVLSDRQNVAGFKVFYLHAFSSISFSDTKFVFHLFTLA